MIHECQGADTYYQLRKKSFFVTIFFYIRILLQIKAGFGPRTKLSESLNSVTNSEVTGTDGVDVQIEK